MKKSTFKKILKIIFLLIIPLIISILWLFSPFEEIELNQLSETYRENNTITYKVTEETIFQPSIKNVVRDIFDTPFDIRWYHFCIQDLGTHVVYGSIPSNEYFEISITFDDGDNIKVTPNDRKRCKLIKFQSEFSFNYGINFQGDVSKTYYAVLNGYAEPAKFVPRSKIYIKPELGGLIARIILFLISWNALYLLFYETVIKNK